MTNPFNSKQNFNDLIFENKNKLYGAYALRREQGDTVTKSMFITYSAIAVLVLGVYFLNVKHLEAKAKATAPSIDSLISIVVNIAPPPVDLPAVEPPKMKEPPKSAYSDNLNIKVVNEPILDPLKVNALLVLNKDGDTKGKIDSTQRHEDPLPPTDPLPPVDPGKVITYATEMPELANMNQFIADNLRYPQVAVESGVSGTVFLSFVVEKDGSVSDVKVLKGIGLGCEEEAMRVVKKMPRWKPGKNHGELVRVQFNLPIRFRLQ